MQIKIIEISTPSSSKLGLAAGSSALSPPEMLFRTWGGGQGGHCTQRTRPRGGWCRLQDCIYLTARPESSKNTHPIHLLNKKTLHPPPEHNKGRQAVNS